jgi:hypothetical protein
MLALKGTIGMLPAFCLQGLDAVNNQVFYHIIHADSSPCNRLNNEMNRQTENQKKKLEN